MRFGQRKLIKTSGGCCHGSALLCLLVNWFRAILWGWLDRHRIVAWRFRMLRCRFPLVIVVISLGLFQVQAQSPARDEITVNADAPSKPFPHFWENMFGSGRANLVMRAN
jgi:hypothetical protein